MDWDGKTIRIERQLDLDGTIREATKTRASSGSAVLLPALEAELREHRSRQAERDLRLVGKDALIFVTRTGQPQSQRNAYRAVQRAADAAGLNGDEVEPVGLHDLRHSFVALALDSGATLAEAALLARHANAAVTARVYSGVTEQAKAQIAAKLTNAGFGS